MPKPNPNLFATKIIDITPKCVVPYGEKDTHALFAIIEANRLIDVFLGISAVRYRGPFFRRFRIDHFFHGIDPHGRRLTIALYSKVADANFRWMADGPPRKAREQEPIRRIVTAQFVGRDSVAMFEWKTEGKRPKIIAEARYQLFSGIPLWSDFWNAR